MGPSGLLVVDGGHATQAVSAALATELEAFGASVTQTDDCLAALFPTVEAAMSAALNVADTRGARCAVDASGGELSAAVLLAQIAGEGQVLATAGARAAAGVSGGFELVSLGLHRLRDLFSRMEVFEVVSVDSAAAAGLVRSMDSVSNNLPGQLDRFVGRHGDLVALNRLLRNGGRRLITLTGPGGMGKSRLALHAAARALDGFPDGVWFIELAPLPRGDAIDHAVFATLGLELHGAASMRDQLCATLGLARVLLVLDNCEHLVASARDFVGDMLARCPNVMVIATSRTALRAPGEQLWLVGSLDAHDAAVELFLDRAAAAGAPGEALAADTAQLADVCRQLDGMPLAIELAASRLRSLSVQDLSGRLGERFQLLRSHALSAAARHSGLDAVLAWSYDLLEPDQREALDRLSVFAGGFELAAAHRVTGAAEEVETLDLLHELVNNSLVLSEERAGRTRFRLLETVRQYGRGRLDDAETARVGRRHAEFYADALGGPSPLRGDALLVETANIRAAVDHAVATGDTSLALTIVGRLWSSLYQSLHPLEAEAWAEAALAMPGAFDEPAARWVLVLRGLARFLRSDYHGAQQAAHDARALELRLGLTPEPRVAHLLAIALMFQGRYAEGEAAARHTAELAASQRRWLDQVEALYDVVQCCVSDDRDALYADIDACDTAAAASGARAAAVMACYTRAIAETRRNPDRAVELLTRSGELAQQAGMHIFAIAAVAYTPVFAHPDTPELMLRGLADTLVHLRQHRIVAPLHTVARDFIPAFTQLGDLETAATIDGAAGSVTQTPARVQRALQHAREALGDDAFETARATGRHLRPDDLDTFLQQRLDRTLADPAPNDHALPAPFSALTAKEREVALAIADGASNREIAERLYLSPRTVETHLTRIYRKLGLNSRAQLVRLLNRPGG